MINSILACLAIVCVFVIVVAIALYLGFFIWMISGLSFKLFLMTAHFIAEWDNGRGK